MQTPAEIQERWRYLRNLLLDQLARFQGGTLQAHANDVDVSASAIETLKQNIAEFDGLILASPSRAETCQ